MKNNDEENGEEDEPSEKDLEALQEEFAKNMPELGGN